MINENKAQGGYQQTVMSKDIPHDSEITKFLLSAEQVIKDKIMHYKGFWKDSETNQYIKLYADNERLINNKGVEFTQRQFYSFLNKNTILAELTKDMAQGLITEYSNRIRRILFRNINQFDIKSVAAIDEIKNDLVEMAWLVLTQCIDGKGRKFTYKPISVVQRHDYAETPQNRKKYNVGW